jgi:hypothetical protein
MILWNPHTISKWLATFIYYRCSMFSTHMRCPATFYICIDNVPYVCRDVWVLFVAKTFQKYELTMKMYILTANSTGQKAVLSSWRNFCNIHFKQFKDFIFSAQQQSGEHMCMYSRRAALSADEQILKLYIRRPWRTSLDFPFKYLKAIRVKKPIKILI